MIPVDKALENIMRAKYGEEVRTSIHDAIAIMDENANEAVDFAKEGKDSAKANAEKAEASAILSESYAVGGTGTREDEDTDNAKYYAEQAKKAAGGGVTEWKELSGKPFERIDNDTLANEDNTLTVKKVGNADTKVLEGLSDEDDNLLYKGKPISGGVSGGSLLHIHTRDFIGMEVTVTDSDPDTGEIETQTATFNDYGVATFHIVGSGIAVATVEDTDGTIYTTNIPMTFYGIYTATINRFSATINVKVETGATAYATSGNDVYSAVSVNNVASINIGASGVYTVTAKVGNVTSDNKVQNISIADGDTKSATIKFAKVKAIFEGNIVATISNGTFSDSFSGSSPVIVYVPSIGDYTIEGTLDDKAISTSVNIKAFEETEVTISASNYYEEWLNSADLTISAYPTLADLLIDGIQNEKDIRKLFTLHASVDKLIEWYNDKPSDFPLDEFLSCRIAVKWIGLRDYACDRLFEIEDVKTALINNNTEFTVDGATKHGWEYILKDCVPQMTGINIPEGVASQSSAYDESLLGYKAFNRKSEVNGDRWVTTAYSSGHDWLQYDFENPITLYRADIQPFSNANHAEDSKLDSDILIQVKLNESDEWSLFGTVHQLATEERNKIHTIYTDTPKTIKSVRLQFQTANLINIYYYCGIANANFFGRSLNENIPCANSDTEPYVPIGEVLSTTGINSIRGALDKNTSTYWHSSEMPTPYTHFVQYKFIKPITVKTLRFMYASGRPIAYINLLASNTGEDGDWTPLLSNVNLDGDIDHYIDVPNDNQYLYYKLEAFTNTFISSGHAVALNIVDFFGVSYSEEEFGHDNIEVYYDNGVNVANCNKSYYIGQTGQEVNLKSDYVSVIDNNGNGGGGIGASVNSIKYAILEGYSNMSGESIFCGATSINPIYTLSEVLSNTAVDINSGNMKAVGNVKLVNDSQSNTGDFFINFVTSGNYTGTGELYKLWGIKKGA